MTLEDHLKRIEESVAGIRGDWTDPRADCSIIRVEIEAIRQIMRKLKLSVKEADDDHTETSNR